MKKLYAFLLLLIGSGAAVAQYHTARSVLSTDELAAINPLTLGTGVDTNGYYRGTVIVAYGPAAGVYTLTNTVSGTNTSTRLASLTSGYSWDKVPVGTFSPTFTGTVTLPSTGITYADGTIQTTAPQPSVKTVVASQFTCYGGSSFTGDNGSSSVYALASSERLYIPGNCYGVTPVYIGYYQHNTPTPGWTYANGFENALPNPLEVALSLTDSTGRQYPQTFYGNRMARLNPYGFLYGDDNLQQYNAGDYLYAQAYVNRLTSNTNTYSNGEVGLLTQVGTYLPTYNTHPGDYKSGYANVSAYATGLNTLEARIDTAGSVTGNPPFTGQGFFPYTYVGYVKASDLKTVVAVGDSITAGIGDNPNLGDLSSGGGYLYRATRLNQPLLNLGVGGDKAQSWQVTNGTSRTTFRINLLSKYKYKYAYVNMGYNDINAAGRSFAQLTNDYANLIQLVYNLTGAKIVVGTITCGQSSASGKYYGQGDLSIQYPNSTNIAPAFNTILRTNPTQLSPYIWKVWDQAALWSPDDINARYLTNSLYQGTVTTTNSTAFLNVYWRTLIDSNANWSTNQWVGQPVQITNTVAPAWPGNMMVYSNTATTLYLTSPPGVANSLVTTNYLTAGATYSIGNGGYTCDGSHPAPWIHAMYGSNMVSQGIFSN